jgi:hypothetical protein
VTRLQYLFFHECHGELGRMATSPDEKSESFNSAAELPSPVDMMQLHN